jgi:hypothetical protein
MTDPSASPASAEAVAAAPSPSEVIRSWLPDHTHVDLPPGPFNLSPVTAWTWTTAAGVWKLTWSRGAPLAGHPPGAVVAVPASARPGPRLDQRRTRPPRVRDLDPVRHPLDERGREAGPGMGEGGRRLREARRAEPVEDVTAPDHTPATLTTATASPGR